MCNTNIYWFFRSSVNTTGEEIGGQVPCSVFLLPRLEINDKPRQWGTERLRICPQLLNYEGAASGLKLRSMHYLISKQRKLSHLSRSIQFSSVAQLCLTLCDPMNHSTPGFPTYHQLLEFTQTHVHRVGDAIQPSHPVVPFSSCPQSLPALGSFLVSQLFA